MVALTGGPEGDTLIRRAARIAARSSGGDLLAVHVTKSDGLTGANPANLASQRQLVESLGGTYHQVVGDNISEALLAFARAENATQLVLGASRRSWLLALLTGPGIGSRTIRGSGAIDVHIVTHSHMGARLGAAAPVPGRHHPPPAGRRIRARRRAGPLPTARAGQPADRDQPHQRHAGVPGRGDRGRAGRRVPARGARRHHRLAAAQLLLHPAHPPVDDRPGEQRAGARRVRRRRLLVSWVVDITARRTKQAARANAESELLRTTAGIDPARPGRARRAAGADQGGVRHALGQPARARAPGPRPRAAAAGPGRPSWTVVACAGEPPVTRPDDADVDVPVTDTLSLALRGRPLPAGDRRVLGAFAAYAAVALEQQRLAAEAEAAKPIAAADRMRTALLAAVSHDLRTPLASAKAAVTSLRSQDVDWDAADTDELLATADESLDRLTHLVGNLLDMCRLQAGALSLFPRPAGLDEIVARCARRPRPGRPRHHGGHPGDAAGGQRRPGDPRARHGEPDRERAALLPGGQAAAAGRRPRWATGWSCGWSTAGPAYPKRTGTGCSCRSSGSATPTTPPGSASASRSRAG